MLQLFAIRIPGPFYRQSQLIVDGNASSVFFCTVHYVSLAPNISKNRFPFLFQKNNAVLYEVKHEKLRNPFSLWKTGHQKFFCTTFGVFDDASINQLSFFLSASPLYVRDMGMICDSHVLRQCHSPFFTPRENPLLQVLFMRSNSKCIKRYRMTIKSGMKNIFILWSFYLTSG